MSVLRERRVKLSPEGAPSPAAGESGDTGWLPGNVAAPPDAGDGVPPEEHWSTVYCYADINIFRESRTFDEKALGSC